MTGALFIGYNLCEDCHESSKAPLVPRKLKPLLLGTQVRRPSSRKGIFVDSLVRGMIMTRNDEDCLPHRV